MIIPNCHLPGNELLDRIDRGSQVYSTLSEEISAHLFGDQSGVVQIEGARERASCFAAWRTGSHMQRLLHEP
jgi:hypothetical protein